MYNQRMKILVMVVAAGLLVLVARLCQLQLVGAQASRNKVERRLHDEEDLTASRGQILDRHNRILALDEPCFDLCMDFGMLIGDQAWTARQRRALRQELTELYEDGQLSDPELAELASEQLQRRLDASWAFARELADRQGQDLEASIGQVRARVLAIRQRVGMKVALETIAHPIVAGLDDEAAVDAKAQLYQTVGLSVRPSRRRWYPHKDVACHIIGLTGPVTAEDIEKSRPQTQAQDKAARLQDTYRDVDRIGRGGVERMCEDLLRARWGYLKTDERTGEVIESIPPRDGQDVRLSLDIQLQAEMMKLFEPGQTGCIVVLDVATNQVLAMVSLPTFDLNRYGLDYPLLSSDEVYLPLRHRAVAVLYPPGSTAKVIAALGGLTEQVVYPGTRFDCQGYLHNPDAFRCWIYDLAHTGHGRLDLIEGIAHSCNVYFYNVGELLGVQRTSDWLRRFGYADLAGTGLPEERCGDVKTPSGAEAVGAARLQAIGQGPVAVTPLHVANAMATIARGGQWQPVSVLADEPERAGRSLGISPMHVEVVRSGMHRVCNQPGATAYKRFHAPDIEPLDFDVSGKTGTAQCSPHRIDSDGDGRITAADRVVREGDMAWFAGFAPSAQPRVAVAVVVEYVEGGGARDAAPIAREALRLCRAMGYIR